jgi:hypothetical protein
VNAGELCIDQRANDFRHIHAKLGRHDPMTFRLEFEQRESSFLAMGRAGFLAMSLAVRFVCQPSRSPLRADIMPTGE